MKFLPPRLLSWKVCAPSEFWEGLNQLCNEGWCSLILLPVCSHGDESSNIPAHLWLCIWRLTFLQQNRLIVFPQMSGGCSKHWSQRTPGLCPLSFVVVHQCVGGGSGLQGWSWILFAKMLPERQTRGGLCSCCWEWMPRCPWLSPVSKLFSPLSPRVLTSVLVCVNQMLFLFLVGKEKSEMKPDVYMQARNIRETFPGVWVVSRGRWPENLESSGRPLCSVDRQRCLWEHTGQWR